MLTRNIVGSLFAMFFASNAAAQSTVRVGEVVPALAGAPEGEVELATAPPPGGSLVVTARDVRAALERAGFPRVSTSIAARTTIRRPARVLGPDELLALTRGALERATSPCTIATVQPPARVTVDAGDVEVRAVESNATPRDGLSSTRFELVTGDRAQTVWIRAELRCPPPEVADGDNVTVIARRGAIRASLSGFAEESGRVGERIRVTSPLARRTLLARVVSPGVVEVVR